MASSSFWAGSRVLVTGGSGFIGRHLVSALASHGAVVTATCHRSPERLSGLAPCIRVQTLDLTEPRDAALACAGQQVVIHAAALDGNAAFKHWHPASIMQANLSLTLNLMTAAWRAGAERFVLISSAEVYPDWLASPICEVAELKVVIRPPFDSYALAKQVSEFIALAFWREHGLNVVIARPNNIYGPGDDISDCRQRLIPTIITTLLSGQRPLLLWGTGRQRRSFLHVTDVVEGLLLLAQHGVPGEPVNFGHPDEIAIAALARLLMDLSGVHVEIINDSSKPSGPHRRLLNTSRARRDLNWQPQVTLQQGLIDTIAWYRQPTTALQDTQFAISA